MRSWKIRPTLDSTICFWASMFMISLANLNIIFYIWVFNITIEVIMKKIKTTKNPNNTLLLLLNLWPKTLSFSIPEHFLGPLYYACTRFLYMGWKVNLQGQFSNLSLCIILKCIKLHTRTHVQRTWKLWNMKYFIRWVTP